MENSHFTQERRCKKRGPPKQQFHLKSFSTHRTIRRRGTRTARSTLHTLTHHYSQSVNSHTYKVTRIHLTKSTHPHGSATHPAQLRSNMAAMPYPDKCVPRRIARLSLHTFPIFPARLLFSTGSVASLPRCFFSFPFFLAGYAGVVREGRSQICAEHGSCGRSSPALTPSSPPPAHRTTHTTHTPPPTTLDRDAGSTPPSRPPRCQPRRRSSRTRPDCCCTR